MKGFQTLSVHRNKIIGLVIMSVGVLNAIIYKIHPYVLFPKMNADRHLGLFMWVITVGMYLTAFSQEKFEDERVKMVRAKSMQLTMMLMSATLLAFTLTAITQDMGELDAITLLIFPSVYLAIYLAVFHVGLYFDDMWDYEDKRTGILQNLKKNKKSIIIFQLITWAILILIFLLLS